MTSVRTTALVMAALLIFSLTTAGAKPNNDMQPDVWTARGAVQYALRANPDIDIALLRIEQAKSSAAMAAASDYPLVNLKGEYSQTDNPMYSFGNILNQGAFDETIDFNSPGRTDNLLLQAEVRYRLYNGGKDQADQQAAQADLDGARVEITAFRQNLGYEVVKTFQAIIQAQKLVEVRQQSLNAITAAFHVGEARYEAGDLLKQDLLNLELQLSRASEELIRSEHNLKITKRIFLNLLGLEQTEVEIDPTVHGEQPLPPTCDYSNRHELTRLAAMEKGAQAALAKARGEKLPSVDAFASYQFEQGMELDSNGDSWSAGLRMNYTLYDGSRSDAGIGRAKSKLLEILSLRRKTELALGLEIKRAELLYQQALERLTVTRKMVGVAEEVARLSRERFKEGVILASDLIDYEMRLSDAHARHLSAEAEHQVAIANLRRAAGYEQFTDQNPDSQPEITQ
ncbi:TolC family protein [Desulforhopalus singaporensis]|uniref:Outer membrane protein TolC n=1 Tax=Desulforhopalus singaporensis TaxID=91360 RepID=A0A1H0JBT1_9BACT|nr:TolC family protein [Desulforhopalus singaporensis]SDO40929.1 Outer membrane protein TolC [Desulforhopalus singaporensis]